MKRTKLKETLDEKPQEVARLSPQQDTGRLHQLERESASEPEGRGGSEKSACSPEGRGELGREPRSRGNLIRFPYSQGRPTTIPAGFPFIEAATTEIGRYETSRVDDYTTSTLKAKRVDFGGCGPPQP